jgi:O-antigen/teichoic acid export membrane protein
MRDLKERTIRGGVAKLCAQAANFVVRLGSLMVIARLLEPQDFGLVGMVTAFTGVLNLFKDFGLSSAAVQRQSITPAQSSTLFWMNVAVGVALAGVVALCAPVIASFYREPRLIPVTVVLATAFVFNSVGVQHSVLLQREMKFTALALISTASLVASTALAITGAATGFGYWALVAMTVTLPLFNTIGCWLTVRWVPGRPQKRVGMRALTSFGGTLTLNGLVYYFASNFDKILLGRTFGVDALGIYGRAYQLINIPTENLNNAAGDVAFSALSRLEQDPSRLRTYFLKGYSLILTITLPVTLICAVFANDVVAVVLGAKWEAVTPIFRLLAPTILAFAMVNPLGWLLISLGFVKRSLAMALAIAPFTIGACLIGVSYGPWGVALAYSTVMSLWIVPAIAWAVHGTVISLRDVLGAASRPLSASVVAAVVAWGARSAYLYSMPIVPRLVVESTIVLVTVGVIVFHGAQEKLMYADLFRQLTKSSPQEERSPASPA